jgi:hypothetical protein
MTVSRPFESEASQAGLPPGGLAGWTPFDLANGPEGVAVRWIDLGAADFSEPFFRDTVNRRLRTHEPRVASSGLETLCALPREVAHLRPSGFIFHAARSGSTLFCNVLKALDDTLVLAEPPPVNQLLSSPARDATPDLWDEVFAGLISCLGQPRRPGQQRYFVKFSSHAVLRLSDIRRVFPDVPWIFLYRHPIEILVSVLEDPPGWLQLHDTPAQAEDVTDIPAEQVRRMSREAFCGAVVQRALTGVLDAPADRGHVINYSRLQPETIGALAGALGLRPSEAERERMRASFGRDAKAQEAKPFVPDQMAKRQKADSALQEIYDRSLKTPYLALEVRALAI